MTLTRTSLLVNVLGLRQTLNLVKQFKNLEAFVYVSSIYANGNKKFIEEKVYPSSVEPQKILNLLEYE
jgi:fatty acyl-CoA reductase